MRRRSKYFSTFGFKKMMVKSTTYYHSKLLQEMEIVAGTQVLWEILLLVTKWCIFANCVQRKAVAVNLGRVYEALL